MYSIIMFVPHHWKRSIIIRSQILSYNILSTHYSLDMIIIIYHTVNTHRNSKELESGQAAHCNINHKLELQSLMHAVKIHIFAFVIWAASITVMQQSTSTHNSTLILHITSICNIYIIKTLPLHSFTNYSMPPL